MVTYKNVTQGTGEKFVTSPVQWVGTDGLATCVGCYIKFTDGVFVGHIDSAQVVTGPGVNYDYVRDKCKELLTAAVGTYSSSTHTAVSAYSSGTDFAMQALRDGIRLWCNNSSLPLTSWGGFKVKTDGSGLTWIVSADVPQNVTGRYNLSVPVKPGTQEVKEGENKTQEVKEGENEILS
ncbi:hypothetical protein GP486_000381 [Trichoglossum hirsutum]|uniref:Uncharacterized protein n=1 Tax=Trichoglossum hirsutum TaxID=265104 RepID=A0A9P8LIU5_9PEZI|nr:hypothetical protein GP486_000381 [Trichoglossum hirsutum]